ncbi:hypothetical protein H8356DRAFT_1268517 [Neocallimastix lanati (nom. inval.)]|jgi:hypothetical protein|uniref:Uncharacterized protein n=1 Tax=Neocallimastix californiae TaxID=1754190 RepID=A0A1Y2F4E7_9FUNG|nr:hypothetical protein H8356DRAFT_1268517 [Neocallimastix sp. JGI-2020a]ORY78770.1 hypothetical protein LY90DRAFT_71150 [Neocallimastix californiae]|eukprot:ORY78770.1 hypothetical protein LY90DRAFT_71150 [Neocallimastix californiae]
MEKDTILITENSNSNEKLDSAYNNICKLKILVLGISVIVLYMIHYLCEVGNDILL